MNDMTIFNNPEFGDVRTIMIDGEPWFVAKDISEILGYSKTFNMMKRIDEEDKRNICSSILEEQVNVQSYTIGIINESGLYNSIFGSKVSSAKKFRKWVTSEVLPQLRKTGSYEIPKDPLKILELHYEAIKQVDNKVNSLEERFNDFEQSLPLLPEDADDVSKEVKKRVVEVLGGKDSNAYHDKSLSQKVFMDAYRNLKGNFDVSSYKAIKRSRKEIAVQIAREYRPPLYLEEQINAENAQLRFV